MYHPTRGPRPRPKSPWRWVVALLIVSFVAYGTYSIVKRFKSPPAKKDKDSSAPVLVVPAPKEPIRKATPPPRSVPQQSPAPVPVPAKPTTTEDVAPSKKGKVLEIKPPTIELGPPKPLQSSIEQNSPIALWLSKANETADRDRPAAERQLLQKLVDAERQKKSALAVDCIEKLYTRPAMVDLQSHLVHRLGQLNMKRLQSETNTPWTALVKVQRGDTLERLSREHRTTMAATQMLNPKLDPTRLKIGMSIRMLNYPNAVLVIHKKLESADLFFRGSSKLFKRYYLKVGDRATPGSYPISNESGMTTASRFSQFGLKPVQANDRKELDMFLAPGSRITVSDL